MGRRWEAGGAPTINAPDTRKALGHGSYGSPRVRQWGDGHWYTRVLQWLSPQVRVLRVAQDDKKEEARFP